MPLAPGTRLGPYQVTAQIGAGGMGEVYKAHDTRLDRSVAIKVLPPEFSADPERRARFEREAKTIAGLTHPHICTLYDVGEHPSTSSGQATLYLVMEYLTGETLAERLMKGALPLEQALTVASEIADALSAAHRQGVIHRDLKPGNVMLTKAGAKLLDFGLAKLKGHGERPAAAQLGSLPTQSTPLTGEGVILGTLQYMAPEQLEGKTADARTDLWALGAILYEMLAGRRAFEGTSAASLIGAILEREPAPLSALQPPTPPAVDRLVRQCLAKAPEDRPDTAHDVANDVRWLREGIAAGTQAKARAGGSRSWTATWAVVLIAAGILVGAAITVLLRPTNPGSAAVLRASLDVRPAESFAADLGSAALAWSPDGNALIFIGVRNGVRQIYVRRLDAEDAKPLPDTEGASTVGVSPDGQFVAFWIDGAIKKVPLAGGPAMTLAAGVAEPPIGLSWDAGGRFFFGNGSGPEYGVRQIMPDGTTRTVTRAEEREVRDGLPSPLPGGGSLLLTVRQRWRSWGDEETDALTLASGARRLILKDAVDARYLSSGHLVFLRRGVLFAVPFDATRLEVTGNEAALLDSVAQNLTLPGVSTGAGHFTVSSTGTLAWAYRPVMPYPDRQLVAVDRQGRVTRLPCPPRSFSGAVRLSPDGKRLAVLIQSLKEVGLWSYDLQRGGLTLIDGGGEAWWPLWSRDGRSLYYTRYAGGHASTVMQPAESGSERRTILPFGIPSSFSPDGQQLALVRDRDIYAVAIQDPKAAEHPLVVTPHQESWPEFSPDGRWLAYASDYSGRWEVYLRPYPGPGTNQVVSMEGGTAPVWHPNGHELFFVSEPDGTGKRAMMAVRVKDGSPEGRPQPLFQFDSAILDLGGAWLRLHDIAADGGRFYTTQRLTVEPRPPVTHINIVVNWAEELKARVPRQ